MSNQNNNNPILMVSTSAGTEVQNKKTPWEAPNPVVLEMKFKKELLNTTSKYLVFKGMKKFHYMPTYKIFFENHGVPMLQEKEFPKVDEFKNWVTTKLYIPVNTKAKLEHIESKLSGNKRVALEIPETIQWELSVPNYLPTNVKIDLKNHLIENFSRLFSVLSQKENLKTGKKYGHNQIHIKPNSCDTLLEIPLDDKLINYYNDSSDKKDIKYNYSILLTNKNYSFVDNEPDSNNTITLSLATGKVDRMFKHES